MRSNIKNISLAIVLIIFIIILIFLLFGKIQINSIFIYIFLATFVVGLGYLIWGYLQQEIPIKSREKLALPSSGLDEDPKIIFRQSLKIFEKQLKTIQPSFIHAIYLIDPESKEFTLQIDTSDDFFDSIDIKNKIFRSIFNEAQTLLIKPNEYREHWSDMINEESTNESYCMLGTKISYGGAPIGGLFALANDVRKFESKDQIFLKQIAQQITISLSIIDNIESLQNHNKILEKIYSITSKVSISDNKSAIYEKVIDVCKTLFKYDKLTIMLGYQDDEHARIEYVDGHALDISINEVFSLKRSIFANVIQGFKTINSVDFKNDFGKKYRFFEDEKPQRSITSVLAVPILVNDEFSGCLAIERFEEKKYSEIDKYYLEKVSQVLNSVLYWQSDYHKMYLNTTHDNLTGLLNYRAFLQRLDVELNRATRNEKSLVIIVLDVDKFKRINDTFGHPTGNIALKQISNLIASSVRSIDIVARYGGEEFIIVLTDSDINSAEQIADRIVNKIANHIFIFNEQRVRITVSAGLAEYPKDSDQVQKLIEAADTAMYNAKKHGGNTFSI